MDVRCEKCQTEYELDEARLKPGGVTVKCTNCGHMFKIRKRSNTNVGAPVVPPPSTTAVTAITEAPRPKVPSKQDFTLRDDDPTMQSEAAPERQWLIRLENGEQKSCRELAMLQQWIVAGVVTRNSLISRSGKTWKSLGDIAELAQYFTIADEARATRDAKPTAPPIKPPAQTMMGIGNATKTTAAGGTIVDDEEGRTTGSFKTQRRGITQPPPPPKSTKTPPMGSGLAVPPPSPAPPPPPTAKPSPPAVPSKGMPSTMVGNPSAAPDATLPAPPRRAATQPPPPPMPKAKAAVAEQPTVQAKRPTTPTPGPVVAPPAAEPKKKDSTWAEMPAQLQGEDAHEARPFSGKIAAITDEPAFAAGKAGRVRVEAADESSFQTGKVSRLEEDDDAVLPRRKGSRAGVWLALVALVVVGAGVGAVYMLVIRKPAETVAAAKLDASSDVAVVTGDAAPAVVPTTIDGATTPAISVITQARGELGPDLEPRLRDAMKALDGNDEPAAQAMRAHLAARLAQDLQDRAGLLTDKAEADKLRKEARTIVIDASTLAQKAHKATPEAADANLAMAEVLRLQGKRPADIKRYADAARADKAWTRDVELADALVLVRDGKLDDAKLLLAKQDDGDGKLETSGDVRARLHRALIELAQNHPNEAKTFVDQILAAQPEHATARALGERLVTLVTSTDPLPPEDRKDAGVGPGSQVTTGSGSGSGSGSATKPPDTAGGGGTYDSYMHEADKIADSNCARALELYQKALDVKPDSAEAHTGMGYCFVDAKQYAQAQSKFRTALRFAPRFEPALFGIAESYHYQGRKDDAIEAYKAYLVVFPGAAKAVKALERLGVTEGGGSATTPTPTPTPTPDGSGSGSG